MDVNTKNSPCKECRDGEDEVSLHAELDHLRQHLAERDSHIVGVEAEFIKSTVRLNDLEEQLTTWREKYERLYDSHKRVQKLNQVLEDKLLQMVDKMKGEKSQLTKDIATLSVRLAEAKHNCGMLQKENERYKNDMNLAIQLLQCKPDNFVAQKLDNLPVDTQARVSQYVMSKSVKSPSSLQSKNGNEIDAFDTSEYEFNISASLMSKILEDSIQDTVSKHCDTCSCNKSQNKPFCYNESYYTIATQTYLTGEIENLSCLNCNYEIKSVNSNVSIRSNSPHVVKVMNDKIISHTKPVSINIEPQEQSVESCKPNSDEDIKINNIQDNKNNNEGVTFDHTMKSDALSIDLGDDEHEIKLSKKVISMEPSVHHKLCDRTKTSISSKKSSVGHEELLIKEIPNSSDGKAKNDNLTGDNISIRKNSHSSMGAVSRTSAKSSASANKSNTQVGPGPRFCHLRMQAGSKNILLDNAQPDVPPVLYKRQSRCNEDLIFRDKFDIVEDFSDSNKKDINKIDDGSSTNIVVESTLIDVHVDNNNKETNVSTESTSINPVLLNVSSSPLQPLKTHNFANSIENNNADNIKSEHSINLASKNFFKDFNAELSTIQNNNAQISDALIEPNVVTPLGNHDVKIFNFDRYEQGKLTSQYNRYLRKIDMSHFHSIENTRISKDISSQDDFAKLEKKLDESSKVIPPIVNVYPNLTQSHLKVNDKKVSTNEQSSSSLSSDDSAAMLQKQQLLRVAEWVEKNLEQQNNFKDPIDEEDSFNSRAAKKDRLSRLNETLNEIALNMPHPVSKYSKPYSIDNLNSKITVTTAQNNENGHSKPEQKIPGHIVKETIFPVESNEATFEINNGNIKSNESSKAKKCKVINDLDDALKSVQARDITAEELARMEYNVKKFLLSGPQWTTAEVIGRSRRTSSKTETDV